MRRRVPARINSSRIEKKSMMTAIILCRENRKIIAWDTSNTWHLLYALCAAVSCTAVAIMSALVAVYLLIPQHGSFMCLESCSSHLEGLSGTCHINPSMPSHTTVPWIWKIGEYSTDLYFGLHPDSPFLCYSIHSLTASEIRYWLFANENKKVALLWISDFFFRLSGCGRKGKIGHIMLE